MLRLRVVVMLFAAGVSISAIAVAGAKTSQRGHVQPRQVLIVEKDIPLSHGTKPGAFPPALEILPDAQARISGDQLSYGVEFHNPTRLPLTFQVEQWPAYPARPLLVLEVKGDQYEDDLRSLQGPEVYSAIGQPVTHAGVTVPAGSTARIECRRTIPGLAEVLASPARARWEIPVVGKKLQGEFPLTR